MINVIIFGSRNVWPTSEDITTNLELLGIWYQHAKVRPILQVYCGKASSGADEAGRLWAMAHKITVVPFPADWRTYGKRAGPIRNSLMAETATHGLGFWDGESRGTANMASHLLSRGKPVRLVTLPVVGDNL